MAVGMACNGDDHAEFAMTGMAAAMTKKLKFLC